MCIIYIMHMYNIVGKMSSECYFSIPGDILSIRDYADFKHYRYGVLLYFLSLLSSNFNITIYRIVGVLGYWKDIVDAINACDKRYMKENMCLIGTSEADDSTIRMEAHIMVG